MKVTLAAAVALVIVLGATASSALDPGPARIRLSAVLVGHRDQPVPSKTYALFNRPAYPDRLGTGVTTCVPAGRGWLDCSYLLRLSRGVIVARALVPSAAAFRLLAIVGGTGYYANAGGEMTVQPLGDEAQLILINLLGL